MECPKFHFLNLALVLWGQIYQAIVNALIGDMREATICGTHSSASLHKGYGCVRACVVDNDQRLHFYDTIEYNN